ncbi:MAG TPA: hypothetical protein PKA37_06180 [Planctomycetota bacterium]|nr:hypothetical protein [Planctomycetota bacterium]
MKVAILGFQTDEIRAHAERAGLTVVTEQPDAVIAYGGDGTFIGSERMLPGIPKLGLRRKDTSIKCSRHKDEEVLTRLARGELSVTRLIKLEAICGSQRLLAVNDVILRNADARAALRFSVELNGAPVTEELIADGLVVCTPFGSSAYFRSITRTVIRTGIGLAYNNCTDLLNHLVIQEDEEIEVILTRGPASLVADNDPTTHTLKHPERVLIRRSADPFLVLAVDTLRCAECRYVHAPRRRF